jgi:ribosomal protein S12 methylthiotransferase accessory factor
MLEKTYLTGKADFLESSLCRMQSALAKHGFELNFSRWLNPAPYIYSVHVKDADCPALFANGKGISAKAAQASACGEFIERLGTHYLFADYYLGNKPEGFLMHPHEQRQLIAYFDRQLVLNPSLWQHYDPHQELTAEHLVSLQADHDAVISIPLYQASTSEITYFPINLLNTLYASNGLAAGNTIEEAAVQAVSEIFERWVRTEIIRHNWCLPSMPESAWINLPSINEAKQALAAQGIRLDIRDASLGGHYPVIAIILHDEIDGRCFVSFGAHPIVEVAIERTLTESLQGRDLAQRDGFAYASVDLSFVQSEENLEAHFIDASGVWHLTFFAQQSSFAAVNWNFEGDIPTQWQTMQQLIQQAGFTLYWHYHQHFDLAVVRLVVPGMSEIYPVTDLLDGNANRGLPLRQALNAIDWRKDRTIESLLTVIDSQAYAAHTQVASLIGLLADPGTPWSWMTIAELKLGCLLYLGDFLAAQQALADVFSVAQPQPAYHALEMALALLVEDRLETDGQALPLLFGEVLWQQIVSWLEGESFLWDIELVMPERFSAQHQALCRAHQRLHRAFLSHTSRQL